MRKMKRHAIALLAACAIGLPSAASAGYLYNWPADATVIDGDDFGVEGNDIIAAWHAQDQAYHYFRIDIETAPSVNSFAGLYGIYIDAKTGGADGPAVTYVPDALSGIDYIVDSHYDPQIGGWFQHDFHYNWDGAIFSRTAPTAVQQSENNGTTLEWKVAAADIGDTFSWWAASHDLGSSAATYDLTFPQQASPVPLPAGLVLFGASLLGLTGFRKSSLC